MLERVNQGIEKVLKWLGILSPIGAFAYVSIAFGTLYLEDFYKLEIYIFAYVLTSLFVTFWFLPTLLTSFTPMKYKDIFRAIKTVCLLPFVTGLSTAALPFLNNYLKKLGTKHEVHTKFRETSQTILPIAYSFGNIGNAMILFFVMFLGYYYRQPLSGVEKGLLAVLTFPLSIGSSTSNVNSILFLIQELGFKQGASEFFLQIKSFTTNFQVLMSIASVLTLMILTLYSYYGLLEIKWKHLFVRLIGGFALFSICIFAFRLLIPIGDVYQNLYMELRLSEKEPENRIEILKKGGTGIVRNYPDPYTPETLKKILRTKILKVGFNPNSIPFCYYNNYNELVGFDIAYALELADSLNCKIQFVPLNFNDIGKDLWDGKFDIGMCSIIMNESRILEMDFTRPYYEDSIGLIVPLQKKSEYFNLKDVETRKELTIGSEGAGIEMAKRHFPNAKIISLNDGAVKFSKGMDAILWSKSTGVIWCLSNPDYTYIDYGDQIGNSYFSYPIRQHATDFSFFLNSWLTLKEQSGFKKEMVSYWIDGLPPSNRPPRWSILKNVLFK